MLLSGLIWLGEQLASTNRLYEAEKAKCEVESKRVDFWQHEYEKCQKEVEELKRVQTRKRTRSSDDSDDSSSDEPDVPVETIPSPRRVRVRQPPLFPRIRYPGPPLSREAGSNRVDDKLARFLAKERLNDIFDDISESSTCRVPRALFERWMKWLVGDRSPDERGIDWRTIPPPGSRKEAWIFRVYSLAHGRAFDARRKTVMDRDVTWAFRHLSACRNAR
ncbi:hypothetical protein HNY73_013445 [Argiope bruennichi]|uniref:Uncharacterized protein n=1 Tax=Argiope bruennichi TaxID=94029 RepID=A0A8T0EY13_ARGBR|nr:hypothetical protein HNY73_013445 [Argiope bruennichi]